MDCPARDFISKFVINDENIYCKVCWTNNETDLFTIQIFGLSETSFGGFPKDKAKKFCENLDENEEDYSKNVKNALKGLDDSYIFDITRVENSTNELRFCWKRKIPGGYLLHGEVKLQKDEPPLTKDHIIEFLRDENAALLSIVEDFKNKNGELKDDQIKHAKELINVMDLKDSIQTELYGKFVEILNTKKKRIQMLESMLLDACKHSP